MTDPEIEEEDFGWERGERATIRAVRGGFELIGVFAVYSSSAKGRATTAMAHMSLLIDIAREQGVIPDEDEGGES